MQTKLYQSRVKFYSLPLAELRQAIATKYGLNPDRVPVALCTPVFAADLETWVEFCTKTYHDTPDSEAVALWLELLANAPEHASETIKTSIRNRWKGLFPPCAKGKLPFVKIRTSRRKREHKNGSYTIHQQREIFL